MPCRFSGTYCWRDGMEETPIVAITEDELIELICHVGVGDSIQVNVHSDSTDVYTIATARFSQPTSLSPTTE